MFSPALLRTRDLVDLVDFFSQSDCKRIGKNSLFSCSPKLGEPKVDDLVEPTGRSLLRTEECVGEEKLPMHSQFLDIAACAGLYKHGIYACRQ